MDHSTPIDQLPSYSDTIDNLRSEVEQQLRLLSDEALAEMDDEVLQQMLSKHLELRAQATELDAQVEHWQQSETLNRIQAFEIQRLKSQLNRTILVSRNIIRICRRALGIVDPEQKQEELEFLMGMAGGGKQE